MGSLFAGMKGLLGSEKAIAAGVLVLASSVLVAVGKMSVAEWREYTLYCLGIYTGGKTVQGAVASYKGASSTDAPVAEAAVADAAVLTGEIEANDAKADKALAEKFAAKDAK